MSLIQKQSLTADQLNLLSTEMSKRQKSAGVAWLLWVFTAGLGGHRFYLGRTGTAVGMLLTLGGLGIWAFIDLFLLNGMIRDTNERIENDIIGEIKLYSQSRNQAAVSQGE